MEGAVYINDDMIKDRREINDEIRKKHWQKDRKVMY